MRHIVLLIHVSRLQNTKQTEGDLVDWYGFEHISSGLLLQPKMDLAPTHSKVTRR